MRVRLSAGVVFAVLVGLLASSSAMAETAAPTVVTAASWIAGHPVTVACDADTNPSPFQAAPGATITAWTLTGGNLIHLLPSICDESKQSVGSAPFAEALSTVIHEAARARGLQTDSCVELLADEGVFDVLRRFYAIQFFSAESDLIGSEVMAVTRGRPASYQPEACWATGTFR